MFDLLFVQLQFLGLTLLACRRIAPAPPFGAKRSTRELSVSTVMM